MWRDYVRYYVLDGGMWGEWMWMGVEKRLNKLSDMQHVNGLSTGFRTQHLTETDGFLGGLLSMTCWECLAFGHTDMDCQKLTLEWLEGYIWPGEQVEFRLNFEFK